MRTLNIRVKTWFDEKYGNTYYSAVLILNEKKLSEKILVLRFTAGYGEQFLDDAMILLIKEKIAIDTKYNLDKYCSVYGIKLSCLQIEAKTKKECKQYININ